MPSLTPFRLCEGGITEGPRLQPISAFVPHFPFLRSRPSSSFFPASWLSPRRNADIGHLSQPQHFGVGIRNKTAKRRRPIVAAMKNMKKSPNSSDEDAQTADSRRGLEMGWRFQQKKNHKPQTCKTCNGSGRVECAWCHATGVLMLGDRLICSLEGQCSCLACTNGEVQCKACKGTGRIASWMITDF